MSISESSAALIEGDVALLISLGVDPKFDKVIRAALKHSYLQGKTDGFFEGASAIAKPLEIQVLSGIVEAHLEVAKG